MARPRARTTPCTPVDRAGRLAKAEQFLTAAELLDDEARELTDAYVTLCVHAGIAAADVICCARLGEHSRGEDHAGAVELLARVDKALANTLSALLGIKTKAGYSSLTVSRSETKRAGRAAETLITAARST